MMIPLLAALVLAAQPVSMEFDGTLKDGLKELAQKSGLNLVVIGEFDEKVNLNLPNVSGEEALETIAEAYGLEVTRSTRAASGKLWVVKRKTAPPPQPGLPPGLPPGLSEPVEDRPSKQPLLSPPPGATAEQLETAAEAAREEAERIREAAQEARETAEEAREQAREAADEAREQAREQAEAAKDEARAQMEVAQAKAELARHRVSTGGPVTVEAGSTVENAVAYGGPVVVEENAVVEGDAVAFGGDVVLKKGAVVEGDAVSFGGSVVREDGSQVHGETVSMGGTGIGTAVARNMVKQQEAVRSGEEEAHEASDSAGRGVAGFLLQFAVFFGLGFVLMLFAPQRMKTLEATIRAEPGKNGLAGFLGAVAAVPLTLMLIVTLVGIPVALLMWIAIALFVPVGLAVIANALGTKVPTGRVRKTQALALALGLLLMLLVGRIPVLGPMVMTAAVFVSMGAIIRTRFGQPTRGTPQFDPMQMPAV
jgi:hypothetical protein